jgi:integrase
MPRVATKLTSTASGAWTARKRIPEDVQDDYERLFGVRWEERFNSGPVPFALAKAKHREWLTAVETRIENIRAEKRGDGRTLTPMQARALSGEWYEWFTARHLPNAKQWGAAYWEHLAGELGDALHDVVWEASGKPWHPEVDPMDIYEENPAAKARALATVADHAESSQFLHSKGLVLEPTSREMLLDCLLRDYFAAMRLLIRRADDDYGIDKWPERFPGKFERTADPGLTPWTLFERWVIEGPKPERSTVNRWRCVFRKLHTDFPSVGALTPDAVNEWAQGLINEKRIPRTVRDTWVNAGRTVFGWAKRRRLIKHNPFAEVKIEVPRQVRNRGKVFTNDEITTILSAALAIGTPQSKTEAVYRWVPWLCAYTGARVGEITQLRGSDVTEQQGIAAIHILPEAGAVKTKQARTVPLHEHLVELGFPAWARANGKGPLFHNEPRSAQKEDDPTNPRRTGAVLARESLARWVRELGVTDTEIAPNHAWRHTFIQRARRHRIDADGTIIKSITGHAQSSEGDKYGEAELKDKADALDRFPRYAVTKSDSR